MRIVKDDIGRQFADTYAAIDTIWNQPVGFILVPILLTAQGQKYKDHPEIMFTENVRDKTIYEVDSCPAIKVRQKTVVHIKTSGTSVDWIYNALKFILTEEFIKDQFTLPNIWLLWHNVHAHKKAITEMHERNRMHKQMSLLEQQQRRDIVDATRNRSPVSFARAIRSLEFNK